MTERKTTSSAAKVLIVEDSPSQAAIIANVVRDAGHIPAVYSMLPMGITQVLRQECPDLVLLDLRILDGDGNPVADGFQLCREIKRAENELPVVIISAENDDDASQWALLQGADAFLRKPFVAEDLVTIMDDALRKR